MSRLSIFLLATWRISSLIYREHGPCHIFDRVRTAIGRTAIGVELLSCFWCFSVWIGLILTPLYLIRRGAYIVLPFALSAGAILLDKVARHD